MRIEAASLARGSVGMCCIVIFPAEIGTLFGTDVTF